MATMTDAWRLSPRIRMSSRGLGAALVASAALHGGIGWFVAEQRPPRASATEVVTSEAEFVELEPVPPVIPDSPEREAEPNAAAATPDLVSSPNGLRVRRPASMPHLSLSPVGEHAGPFGLRDRLTIGQYTPRVVPTRTSSSSSPGERDTTAASEPGAESTPEASDEPIAALEPSPLAAAPEDRPPLPQVSQAEVATSTPAAVLDESVSVELETLPTSPLTEPALAVLASASLRAELGLDDTSLRSVTRIRPRASRSSALAFTTSLEATELRARLEAALAARGIVPEFAERDGTLTTTAVVDGAERTIVIDGNMVVLADPGVGSAAISGRAIARARARRSVGDGPMPIVSARLPSRLDPESGLVTSLVVRVFAPSETLPKGRMVVIVSIRTPVLPQTPSGPSAAEGAPIGPATSTTPIDWVALLGAELGLDAGSLELTSVPDTEGLTILLDARPVTIPIGELAARVAERR
jgi:hypothetical protein